MAVEIITQKDLDFFGQKIIHEIKIIMTNHNNKEYVIKAEALKILDCSSRQLDSLRLDRRIAFTKVGKSFQYKTSSLLNLLRFKTIEAYNSK